MSEIQHNEIVYEEGWRQTAPVVQQDVPVDEMPPETSDVPADKPEGSKPLLISIQLVLCLMAALVLFLLKAMDSEGYYSFMDYYREELQKPVVSQEAFSAVDVNRLFSEDLFTVRATPDEAAHRED